MVWSIFFETHSFRLFFLQLARDSPQWNLCQVRCNDSSSSTEKIFQPTSVPCVFSNRSMERKGKFFSFKFIYLISFASEDLLSYLFVFLFSLCRSRGFIFYLLSKSQLWMYHLTWKLVGVLLSFQTPYSWKCQMHPRSATCFLFRMFYPLST